MTSLRIATALQKTLRLTPLTTTHHLQRHHHHLIFRNFPHHNTRKMSISTSPSTTPPDAQRILDYWFAGPSPETRWFGGGPTVDAEISSRFSTLITSARSSQLNHWTSSPSSTLALLILLDQFPRNVYRGSSDAFSSDAQALEIATVATAKGFDREVPVGRQGFFYLPFEHAEELRAQVAAVACHEAWVVRCVEAGTKEEMEYARKALEFARRHCVVVSRFGRFPSRNGVFGRTSTAEEEEFLKEHPTGF